MVLTSGVGALRAHRRVEDKRPPGRPLAQRRTDVLFRDRRCRRPCAGARLSYGGRAYGIFAQVEIGAASRGLSLCTRLAWRIGGQLETRGGSAQTEGGAAIGMVTRFGDADDSLRPAVMHRPACHADMLTPAEPHRPPCPLP